MEPHWQYVQHGNLHDSSEVVDHEDTFLEKFLGDN